MCPPRESNSHPTVTSDLLLRQTCLPIPPKGQIRAISYCTLTHVVTKRAKFCITLLAPAIPYSNILVR